MDYYNRKLREEEEREKVESGVDAAAKAGSPLILALLVLPFLLTWGPLVYKMNKYFKLHEEDEANLETAQFRAKKIENGEWLKFSDFTSQEAMSLKIGSFFLFIPLGTLLYIFLYFVIFGKGDFSLFVMSMISPLISLIFVKKVTYAFIYLTYQFKIINNKLNNYNYTPKRWIEVILNIVIWIWVIFGTIGFCTMSSKFDRNTTATEILFSVVLSAFFAFVIPLLLYFYKRTGRKILLLCSLGFIPAIIILALIEIFPIISISLIILTILAAIYMRENKNDKKLADE